MKRSSVAVLVLVLLAVAGGIIATLAQQNFNLKVERGNLLNKLETLAKATPPRVIPPPAPTAPSGRSIGPLTRQLMTDALAAESGTEKKLWVRVDPKDREAATFAAEIASVFRDSHWEVQVLDNGGLRFKPGLLVLIGADSNPASYVQTAQAALGTIGEEIATGTGYLAYYETKKRDTPGWTGTAFLPGQTYLLVVGRHPDPAAPAPDVSSQAQ